MCMLTTDRQTVNNYSSHPPRANLLQFQYKINGIIKVAETVDIFSFPLLHRGNLAKRLYNSKTYIHVHHYMSVCYALKR